MDAINTWTPWAKFISLVKISRYLRYSLATDLSHYLDIAATLVQLINSSLLEHVNLPILPPQPSLHVPRTVHSLSLSLFFKFFKIVYPIRPWLCWKLPMAFCNRIKCKHPAWFREPCWDGPCQFFQPIASCLLSMLLPKPKLAFSSVTTPTSFSAQGALLLLFLMHRTFLPHFFPWLTSLIMYVSIHASPQRRPSILLLKVLSSPSHRFYFIHLSLAHIILFPCFLSCC